MSDPRHLLRARATVAEWQQWADGVPQYGVLAQPSKQKTGAFRLGACRYLHAEHFAAGSWGDAPAPSGSGLLYVFPERGDFVAIDFGDCVEPISQAEFTESLPRIEFVIVRKDETVSVVDVYKGRRFDADIRLD